MLLKGSIIIDSYSVSAKFAFRVNPKELTRGKSIILQANDQHDKKQWLNALSKVASMPSKGDPS